MENRKEFQFKTNINCSGCIAQIKPQLDNTAGISDWSVDTDNKDKVLTVAAEGLNEQQIIETIQKSGFKAEPLPASDHP